MKARAGVLVLSSAAAVAFSSFSVSATQDPKAPPKPAPLVIQVGLDLVQIDVAVTDKQGRPVTDLRAEDFILEVDGRKQPLTNAAYFGGSYATNTTGTGAAVAVEGAGASLGSTVVFIIDDLNMSFGSMYHTRRGLTRFASEWGGAGTRAAIRTTSEEESSFTLFTSADAFEDRASELRYNLWSNQGIGPARTMLGEQRIMTGMSADAQAAFVGGNPSRVSSNLQQRLFSLVSTINTMRGLPGRKALVLVSEGFTPISNGEGPLGFESPMTDLFTASSEVREALRLITEVANRASVVLYTVDPRGLMVDFPGADEAGAPAMNSPLNSRAVDRIYSQGSLQELAEATGGLAVINRNDLRGGFSQVVRDQEAYYLIGFEPDAKTFEKPGGRPRFHKIRLKVNRPDVRVRTRAGFYGVTDDEVNKRAPLAADSPTP